MSLNKSENKVVYLDYNATTYIHEDVRKAMEPFLNIYFGNPSSSHIYGIEAKKAIQKARKQTAEMISCNEEEIIFTSGGSESNNYATKGIILKYLHDHPTEKISVMCSSIEHPSVIEIFKYLESIYKDKIEIIYLPVTNEGIINMEYFKEKMSKNVIYISVMLANNETGCLQPIKDIVKYSKNINPSVIVHTDASQAVGKILVDSNDLNADLITIVGHKMYGPKGIGALYIKTGVEKKLEKLIHGASHEKNLRAGTENVLEIVGFGKACELVKEELVQRVKHNLKTRNMLYKTIKENTKINVVLQGPEINYNEAIPDNFEELNKLINEERRLTNTLYISFPNVEANLIMSLLSEKLACSAGAACHSEGVTMSYVLEAMKVTPEVAMGTLRLSTGIKTTLEEVAEVGKLIAETVNKLANKNTENNTENSTNDKAACKLTMNTRGLGCGCKIPPKFLNDLLSNIPSQKCIIDNKKILVSNDSLDDASVVELENGQALISTLDFFTPICNDPYDFGQISCANALSDIYAMGGRPLSALSIVSFPITRLDKSILENIIKGAQDKADEANCPVLGGHSVDDNEPKFGLSVNGICKKEKIWKNNTIQVGNIILLTKKIGTGIIMTAIKENLVKDEEDIAKKCISSMKKLSKEYVELLENTDYVDACTDITGFGLVGHSLECNGKSLCKIKICFNKIPFLDGVKDLVGNGCFPGAAKSNMSYVDKRVKYQENITDNEKIMLNDPQTSGGLLLFIKRNKIQEVKELFKNVEYYEIGTVEEKDKTENEVDLEIFKKLKID